MEQNPPPFWQKFGFFFQYLKQEKLYYQITLLAIANLLLAIPLWIISILIWAMLFLASYKLAFEVLHTVSSGQMEYADSRSYEVDDNIGFKAMAMAVVQLLIFIFVYRSDPPVGLALLIVTIVVTPAYLMMLSKTQSLVESFNPVNLMTVMTRIGTEYVLLLVFFMGCAAFNLAFRFYTADVLPGLIGDVITAWVLYFLLVFTFLVIGYVMYRHADELGHDTVDVEVVDTQTTHPEDPIKERVLQLLEDNKPQEAIGIIKELKNEDGRTDLDSYLAQAESLLVHENRQRPAEKLQDLVQARKLKEAVELYLSYADDGHLLKPESADIISQMIKYTFAKNQFNQVLKLCRDFDKRYPLEHEHIVNNFFLVAKIYYQHNKVEQSKKLLQTLIKKYSQTTNTQAISSYLKGIEKLSPQ